MPDYDNNIDWTAPAADIRDRLIDAWFWTRPGVSRDSDTLADAEAWADEMFESHAD